MVEQMVYLKFGGTKAHALSQLGVGTRVFCPDASGRRVAGRVGMRDGQRIFMTEAEYGASRTTHRVRRVPPKMPGGFYARS